MKIIRNIISAAAAIALCADLSGCDGIVSTATAAPPAATPPPASAPTAPQNLTVNLLGIGAPAGSATGQVQYLQVEPGPTIAELINKSNSGQVATLWTDSSFSKELELCLDIAEADCAGTSIPGAAGDGHLWSHNVLHIISYTATVFEDKDNQYGSISSAGLALSVPVVLPMSTVAELPECGPALNGGMAAVSDAAAPAYNAPLTGGGAASIPVYCNGVNWTAH